MEINEASKSSCIDFRDTPLDEKDWIKKSSIDYKKQNP